MAERFFLYIDILGFKEMIRDKSVVTDLYEIIDSLNVHRDGDFTCIVFSDTIVVYASEVWLGAPNQAIMWLIEFAQDLHYRLIVKDIHFRAYVTFGDFEHYKLKNLEAYFGEALVSCYEKEKTIKCTGVFLDATLVPYCNIFQVSPYDDECYFVHVMQHLGDISAKYEQYPISGEILEMQGMEWWVAYLLVYLKNIHSHKTDEQLHPAVRLKYETTWAMIQTRHDGLLRRLEESKFDFAKVVKMDWSEPLSRIGTDEGAWG